MDKYIFHVAMFTFLLNILAMALSLFGCITKRQQIMFGCMLVSCQILITTVICLKTLP